MGTPWNKSRRYSLGKTPERIRKIIKWRKELVTWDEIAFRLKTSVKNAQSIATRYLDSEMLKQERECDFCETPFRTNQPNKKYCGKPCRVQVQIALSRIRKKRKRKRK